MVKIIAKGTILVFSFFMMLGIMAMSVQSITGYKNPTIEQIKYSSQKTEVNNYSPTIDHLEEGRKKVRKMYGNKVEIVQDFVETKRTRHQRYSHVDNYSNYVYHAVIKDNDNGMLKQVEYSVDFTLDRQ